MILLDTNAYSALVLGKESVVSRLPNQGLLYLCLPVIAELRLGFRLGNKNEDNENKLQKFLATNSIIDINLETTIIYAQLAAFARQCGISLSQNDLWIAAICQQNDAYLFTYEKDFEVFSELFGEKLLILDN